MTRKNPTSRFRGTDMFSRRIVITIPRSGVFLLAVAVGGALILPASQGKIMTTLGLVLSVVAIVSICEARFQLRNFRFEIDEKITAQIETLVIPFDPDLRESVEAVFEEVSDDAPARFIRLPKRPNSSRGNQS